MAYRREAVYRWTEAVARRLAPRRPGPARRRAPRRAPLPATITPGGQVAGAGGAWYSAPR